MGDLHAQAAVLHHHARPRHGGEGIAGDHVPGVLDQRGEEVEGAAAQRHRHAVRHQLAPSRPQQEGAKAVRAPGRAVRVGLCHGCLRHPRACVVAASFAAEMACVLAGVLV
ncbi:hypothetical protein D3C86_1929190 [compost metagenome]